MILPVPVKRLGYRLAYSGLRVYWWLFRPTSSGVKCVVTNGDDVLLVRHTYGPRGWELPGGARKRGEEPAAAATREIQEEVGLSIDAWEALGRFKVMVENHRDNVYAFHAEVPSVDGASPDLVLDLGEIATARWFPKADLPQPLGRYTRVILSRIDELA